MAQGNHNKRWSGSASTATVGASPVPPAANTVVGPTPFDRELGFGRGIASADRAPTWISRSIQAVVAAGAGRRMFALVSVMLISAIAAGCGGGDEASSDVSADSAPTTPTTPTTPAGTGDAATGAPAAGTPGATGSLAGAQTGAASTGAGIASDAEIVAAPGTQLETSDQTPKAFVEALGKRTIVVAIYQPTSTLDEATMREVRAAIKKTPGTLLLTYSAGDFKKYGDLPERVALLGATPGVAVVDRSGKLQNFFRTYVDRNLLALTIRLANRAKAAKVTPGDVPTATPESGFDQLAGGQPSASSTSATTSTSGMTASTAGASSVPGAAAIDQANATAGAAAGSTAATGDAGTTSAPVTGS